MGNRNASSGHKLGQLVGDWFEEYFVLPLLQRVGNKLDLFVDSRFANRIIRDGKLLWADLDGNSVDYDYVLELGGSESKTGIPVAFIECFWRRGSRHSKDKARDDSGKLMPMRETFPTARFLGIISAGDFTQPARELVISRGIDLFYVPKDKVIKAFESCGLMIDYPDKLPESKKATIVRNFEQNFAISEKKAVQKSLIQLVGQTTIRMYVDRVRASLSAMPQEIRLILRHDSKPFSFDSVASATDFLDSPKFYMESPIESFLYQVTYSDGTEFEKTVDNIDELKLLHKQISTLTEHMDKLCKN